MAQVGLGIRALVERLVLGSCLLASCASAPAAPKPPTTSAAPAHASTQTVTGPLHGTSTPTTDEVVLQRLESTLKEIPIGAQVPRIAIGDVAYPSTPEEFTALGGFALLLVTACSHGDGELPLERVVVRTGDKTAELPIVTLQKKALPPGALAQAFGARRVDAVYLLPVFATRVNSTVIVRFRGVSHSMDLLRFPAPASEDRLPQGLPLDNEITDPLQAALDALIRRELPLMQPGSR